MSHHHLPRQSGQLWVADNGARDTNFGQEVYHLDCHNILDSGVAIVSAFQVHNLLDTLELTVSVAFKLWILWRQKPNLSCNSPSAFSLPYRQHGSYSLGCLPKGILCCRPGGICRPPIDAPMLPVSQFQQRKCRFQALSEQE
jgi:hypothetical protein